jgi:hypothetical protein
MLVDTSAVPQRQARVFMSNVTFFIQHFLVLFLRPPRTSKGRRRSAIRGETQPTRTKLHGMQANRVPVRKWPVEPIFTASYREFARGTVSE